jgi:hypothetical protein
VQQYLIDWICIFPLFDYHSSLHSCAHIQKQAQPTPAPSGANPTRAEKKENLTKPQREFFSMLAFFNHYSRNEPGEMFFPNLALLSRANPSSATYKGVTPVHLT